MRKRTREEDQRMTSKDARKFLAFAFAFSQSEHSLLIEKFHIQKQFLSEGSIFRIQSFAEKKH